MDFEDQRPSEANQRSLGERLAPWVVLSLLFHALLVAALAPTVLDGELFGNDGKKAAEEAAHNSLKTKLTPPAQVKLPPKAQQAVNEARQKAEQAARLAPKPPEPEPPKPEPKMPKGQIVDIARPDKEEVPDKADYLSSYNSTVKKQTRAKKTMPTDQVAPKFDKGQMKAPEGPIGTSEEKLVVGQEEKAGMQGNAGASDRLQIPKQQAQAPSLMPETHDPNGLMLPGGKRFKEGLEGNSDRLAMIFRPNQTGQQGIDSRPGGVNIPKSLLPDLGLTYRDGGAPMNDHLKGVEEGDGTWLNTKAFKYASFFNRVKLKIAQRWHPDEAQQRYDPTYSIYGYQNRYTVISIELSGVDGRLNNAEVERSSGVDFLDREALSAVQLAAPFPNPPKGLAEDDGKIKFPFGFYFELSRAGVRLR